MDSTTHKLYHIHGMDSRDFSDSYCSDKEDMVFGDDSLKFPMANLHYQFNSGRIAGNFLIDITLGSPIHHLYSASKIFQDIVVLKFNEKCIIELNRWLNDRTGAYDWTHTTAAAAELEGERDQLLDKDVRLKSSIKQIVKCDFGQENITSPVVLPLADCVLSLWILNAICKNENDYMKYLEKMVKLLKPGGHLSILSVTDATYYTVGGERMHCFKHDEKFVKNALKSRTQRVDIKSVQLRGTMDSTTHKLYHIHGIDSRNFSDLYCSGKEDMIFGDDTLKFPMANLHYQFNSGRIAGKFMIDITLGSLIQHLYSASKFFQDIVVLKFNEKCIMELSRWLHDRTGAYDWKHTSAAAAELEGERDQLQDKEMRLKSSIKQIVKCDFEQENITSPVVLPLADCVVSAWILETISKNEDEYMRNMGKILKLLKPGGHLIIISVKDESYFTAGGERFYVFNQDERFLKNALSKLGLVVDYCAVQRRRNVSDLVAYSAVMFTVAHKPE